MARSHPRYGEAREALLAAVVRTVARTGLRGLTYRAVAAEAGVSYGAISHHFRSREALIAQALERTAQRAVGLASMEPGKGDVAEFVGGLSEVVEQTRDALAFQFELALEARRDPTLQGPVRDLYRLYRRAIARELNSVGLGDDPAFTRLVFAALDGLVFQLVTGVATVEEVDMSLTKLRTSLSSIRRCRIRSREDLSS